MADDGARHVIVHGSPDFFDIPLGGFPDGETDGQPGPDALGDDNDAFDDEAEREFIVDPSPFVPGELHFIGYVFETNDEDTYVNMWVDWNQDGDWDDDGEVEDYQLTVGACGCLSVTPLGGDLYQFDTCMVTPNGVATFLYGRQPGQLFLPGHDVTVDVTDPVYFAQGIADPSGHAVAIVSLPPSFFNRTVYFQVFEQMPNPQTCPPVTVMPAQVTPLVVNSTADLGDNNLNDGVCDTGRMVGLVPECTLRAAIEEANMWPNLPSGPDVILFDIPGAGPHTITPGSMLPTISEAVVIGGTVVNAENVISGNSEMGVLIAGAGAAGNTVEGNLIGTDQGGTNDLGNTLDGVRIQNAPSNTIGGTAGGAGNLISGNDLYGVRITSGASLNMVQGNLIGTDIGGTTSLGNTRSGMLVSKAASNTIGGTAAGAGNDIGFNGWDGVELRSNGTQNAIHRNSIFSNTNLGIDLGGDGVTANDANDPDTGANRLQNFPEVTSAVLDGGGNIDITYAVPSIAPNSTYPLTVEFFVADASGAEGETFLGSTAYAAPGTTTTSIPQGSAVAGSEIVATATDATGNTSEFSAPETVASPLLAAGGEARRGSRVDGQELEADELLTIVEAAIDRLVGVGFAAKSFSNVQVAIAELPGATLGLATGDTITIDVNAAGYGWFIDATPLDDSEFSLPRSAFRTPHSMDLLTVVMHELGHTAGLEDLYGVESEGDLMYAWLEAGERRVAEEAVVDSLFASFE